MSREIDGTVQISGSTGIEDSKLIKNILGKTEHKHLLPTFLSGKLATFDLDKVSAERADDASHDRLRFVEASEIPEGAGAAGGGGSAGAVSISGDAAEESAE
jgi:hypothetical protein